MSYTPNDHEKDYGVKHVLLSPRDKDGVFPLRKTGKANYDEYWNKKVVKGITEHFPHFKTVAFINKKGEMDTKQERDFTMPAFAGYEEYVKIEPYCYNCHKLLGEAEKANNYIGLCIGECTFD